MLDLDPTQFLMSKIPAGFFEKIRLELPPPPIISISTFLTIRLTASSLAGSHSLDVETLILVVSDFFFFRPCCGSSSVGDSSSDGGAEGA